MKPPPFDYHRAATVDEALEHLRRGGPEAKILAGGQSLIPMLKLRLARPSALIDINRVPELNYLRAQEDGVVVGATARLHELESASIGAACPMLGAAVRHVAHTAIRTRGTVCGSLAHGDPAAELPLVACCLDAELQATSARGSRTIAARDFFVSFMSTALEADELLTRARFPPLAPGAGWSFRELTKRMGDFAIASVAVVLERGPSGAVHAPRIALGAVADRPLRRLRAEAALAGQPAGAKTFSAAAEMATADLDPPSDVHGSSAFRRTIVRVLLDRALHEAWQRTGARP
jgi:carbon-monoxide dehydrogenase medium subunit